jgi:diaminohydroxyphosphoribosylaminopyrimidine deaminase / 5-amino-6-(5-phosphoribosylamino)uracil reductase
MIEHQTYMLRCIALAKLGTSLVASNPLVGAVLVYNNNIIGEGYHQQFGAPHAEVNCINSVSESNQPFIEKATLYISLEPCNHFGKTPPCTDLIISHNIKNVVIGCIDPNPEVSGKGLIKLKESGVNVIGPICENECLELNQAFFYTQQNQKSFIVAKWAQSQNGFINENKNSRTLISNNYTQRWVHKLRSQFQAILVGSNTIAIDNPYLNCRLYNHFYPTIIIIDRYLKLDLPKYNIYNAPNIIVVNTLKAEKENHINYWKINDDSNFYEQLASMLFSNNIHKVLVEGGATIIDLMLKAKLLNTVYTITNLELHIDNGIAAPALENYFKNKTMRIGNDEISVFATKNI